MRVANFLFPYLVQLFPSCVENLMSGDSPPIMQSPGYAKIWILQQLCKVLSSVLIMQGPIVLQLAIPLWCCLGFLLLLTLGNVCESVP